MDRLIADRENKELEFCRAVSTVGSGSQIYITTHMFYEDLADIQDILVDGTYEQRRKALAE